MIKHDGQALVAERPQAVSREPEEALAVVAGGAIIAHHPLNISSVTERGLAKECALNLHQGGARHWEDMGKLPSRGLPGTQGSKGSLGQVAPPFGIFCPMVDSLGENQGGASKCGDEFLLFRLVFSLATAYFR